MAGELEITEITDVPYDMKLIAEIENLNKKTFKLIQIIQSKDKLGLEKKAAYEELKSFDGFVNTMHDNCLKIKRKELKKELFGKLLEAKTMQGNIY